MNFSILDWNIQGTKYYTGTKLHKVLPTFEKNEADIFCIQEGQELVNKFNFLVKIKDYNLVHSDDNRNGLNVIISRFPIISSGKLVLPLFTDNTADNVIWANIKIGDKILKIYNCHLEIIGVGSRERSDKLKYILADSKEHSGPTIICGDFNTTIPKKGMQRKIVQLFHKQPNHSLTSEIEYAHLDEKYHFKSIAENEGFCESLDILKSTWCISIFGWKIFNFKLDWFLVRDVKTSDVELGKYISDHRSIFVKCSV